MESVRLRRVQSSKQTNSCLGPEVVEQAVRVLQVVSDFHSDFDLKLETHKFGGCAIDATGEPLPPSTLKACQEADAILMGTL
jgi:3-isopropylmalate dehydrogenase